MYHLWHDDCATGVGTGLHVLMRLLFLKNKPLLPIERYFFISNASHFYPDKQCEMRNLFQEKGCYLQKETSP